MKMEIMALRDSKLDAFIQPFFAQTIGSAMRAVADMVNGRGDEPPSRHPEDFSLWHLGTWDDVGVFELEAPSKVADCDNLRTKLEVVR